MKKWILSVVLSVLLFIIVLSVTGNLDAFFSKDLLPMLIGSLVLCVLFIRLVIFALGRSSIHYGKTTCKVCGNEAGTPLILRYPISDGHICHNCFKKLGYKYWATYPYKRLLRMSSDEVAAKIQEHGAI